MTKHNISKKRKEEIVKEISSQLNKGKNIIFSYIFGSFVTDDKFSDIDIGVFCTENISKEPLDFEFELEEKIKSFAKLPVDVRVINHAPLSFVYRVIKEGILIADKDIGKRTDFEGMIFKKYMDFAIYRKRYLKEVMNAPI
ncbi:MAG: nucleotidyltransferase domain-containing protein [Candidatus Aminicenantes bacterium]